MTRQRTPMEPPELPGYEFEERLGSGGFADVFLYRRLFPEQQVAIKVLDVVAGDDGLQTRFTSEANAMAKVSTHPFIVSILHADISSNGHPFLVMEYYPGLNYAVRSRTERFTVPQVLRLGVQVASAVETAHRAGILHRDIKPANLLTSVYGRPGLTDFGISSSMDPSGVLGQGLSIPWAPPELFDETSAPDRRSDVYSLAATLYTLLAGRSPYESTDEPSKSIDLIERIERSPLPPIGRSDVPPSLFRLLAQAMDKRPERRPATAADLARSLQTIEVESRLDTTPFEVADESPVLGQSVPVDPTSGETRFKGPRVVHGQDPLAPSNQTDLTSTSGARRIVGSQITGVPAGLGPLPEPPSPAPVPPTSPQPKSPASATYRSENLSAAPAQQDFGVQPPRRRSPIVVAAVSVLVVMAVAAVIATSFTDKGLFSLFSGPDDAQTVQGVEPPMGLKVDPDDDDPNVWVVRWSWDDPNHRDGDIYEITYDQEVKTTEARKYEIREISDQLKPVSVRRIRTVDGQPVRSDGVTWEPGQAQVGQ